MLLLLLTHVPYGQTMEETLQDIGILRFIDVPLEEVKQENKSGLLTFAVTGIELSCFGNVFLNQGEQESLIIEANESMLPHVIIHIRRGILTFEVSDFFPGLSTLNFYLTLRNLRHITISGAGDVTIQNGFRTPELIVKVSGSGDVRINNLMTTDFAALIIGNGNVEVKGTTTYQNILISGSGDYKGNEFNAVYSDITIVGEGNAEITTQKTRHFLSGRELSGKLIANGHRIEY